MYEYELNTSIAMFLIDHVYRMHKRSILQLRIMFTLIFWMLCVHRGYTP